jgi:hypothetical protein
MPVVMLPTLLPSVTSVRIHVVLTAEKPDILSSNPKIRSLFCDSGSEGGNE